MADFNFTPIQMQLFGGQNTAWEPLGQEGNLKPYQQQMGYDLYSKVFTDFNADRFRASITSDPARMQQAEQLFNQIDSMQFKSMSPYDGMQRGWTSGNSWVQGAGYDFSQPQLGAGSMNPALSGNPNVVAQREAAFQNAGNMFSATPMSAPNWGGTTPFASVGGSRVDVTQFSPEAQQQIWSAMGMGGSSVGGGAGDPVDTVSRLAKVLKEELSPATEGVTQKIGSLVGIMRGDGGAGGFGGGGFGGGGGVGMGGNDDWWNGQVRPEVVNAGLSARGIGGDMPRWSNSDFAERGGGLGLSMPGMFKIRQGYSMFINPMMQDMNTYMEQSASQAQMLQSSGMIGYDDMMGGQYGAIQRREASGQEFGLAMGRNIYSAYGGIANAAMGGETGRGIGGAVAAIGSVSIGAGLMGAGIGQVFGPIGMAAGGLLGAGGAAIIGAGGYAADAATDPYAIGSYLNSGDKAADFRGAIGVSVENLRYYAGTRTDAETNMLRNAQAYTNNVNKFAAGEMSTQDLRAWSTANGYSGAGAVTQGLETFYTNNTANNSWTREQQEPVMALDLMLNPNKLPGSMPQQLTLNPAQNAANRLAGEGLFREQMSLGSTYAPWMQQNISNIAGAMGVSSSNQGGMNDLMTMYTNRMYDLQQSGGNVSLYQESLAGQIDPIGRINQARYQAGYGSVLGLDNYAALSANPYIKADVQGIDAARYGYQASSPGFAANVGNILSNRAQAYSQQGQPGISGRIQSQMPGLLNMYQQAESYGADASGALIGLSELAATNEQMGAVGYAIAGGDRRVLSQYASAIGDERLNTINTQTGMGIRYSGAMSRGQYNMMQNDQPDLFRLSFDQAQGGEKQWEQNILNSQRGLDLYQYQQATAGRNINYQVMTGGSTGVGAQGFASGGDGLAALAQLFQSQGMNLQTGNGMGLWQVQDAQIMLQRQQQQYGSDTQGQRLSLSNQQWNESFALNQQQFNLSTAYQRSEMNIGRSQQQTQESWQAEDLGLSRNKMELNFGWQMEDFDRNIRFARGRDRQNLMREQERATIMHGLDETGQDNQEERFETQKQWNKEEFDRKKSYFEQSKALQQEEMNLNKKHHDEMQHLNQEAHDKEKQWMTQEWGLQDQQRRLTRQSDELQYKMATDMAIAVENTRQNIIPYQDALKASGLEYQEQEGHIKTLTMNMSVLAQWLDVVSGKVGSITGTSVSSSGGGGGPATPTPYMSGNHTNGGGYGDIAARSVSGETSGGTVGLLTEIRNHLRAIEAMGPGRVNATIYTNDNQVKTSNLYQKSLRQVN